MILLRDIFHAKYGKGNELLALFKEAEERWPDSGFAEARTLTDLSGPFFTIVRESQRKSLADLESRMGKTFALPGFEAWFARMTELVDSGSREYFTIVE